MPGLAGYGISFDLAQWLQQLTKQRLRETVEEEKTIYRIWF